MNASKYNTVGWALGVIIIAAASGASGYWIARRGTPAASSSTPITSMPSQQRNPLYWYDPMQPGQHFDKPGKSPFMDMQLVPKYADEAEEGGSGSIRIDPSIIQNLGVRTTQVERGALSQPVEALGTLGFNQRDIAVVQARANGFVTKVYARAPGDVIGRGAPIVDLLVPEWAGAQAEFLVLLKTGDRELIDAARQRLLLLGIPAELLRQVEQSHESRATVTVQSPLAGMIESLDVHTGMTVATGATLAKINGLATVWLEAAIPEARSAIPPLGESVGARLAAYPGQRFNGRVIAILPQANVETHTVRVRIELPNADGGLKPGMFAQVRLDSGNQAPLLYVDSEAVIHSGTRTLVIVSDGQGRFTPKEVRTGADLAGKTVILGGLIEGERVVASGQFLIDSEASLKGVLARLGAKPGSPQ